MKDVIINKNSFVFDNEKASLTFHSSCCEMNFYNNNEIVIINGYNDLDLTYILENNSCVKINQYENNQKASKHKIKLILKGNAKLEINYSLLVTNKIEIEIDNYLKNSNNQSNIKIAALCVNEGMAFIKVNGEDEKKTTNNSLLENIKILTFNEKTNTIVPNLFVNSSETIATHNATIGGIDQTYLTYLMGKGLSLKSSELLIKIGFMMNNLSLDNENLIKIKNDLLHSEVI